MAPLRRVQLDRQAVGGLVGRVAGEDLLEESMGFILPAGGCGLSGRRHRHDLPASEETLPWLDEPIFVGIVGQQRSSAKLQHGCHGIALRIGCAPVAISALAPGG